MNTITGANTHEPSGLLIMPMAEHKTSLTLEHLLNLPQCCPASGNPRPGSTLSLTYTPKKWTLEVYSLRSLIGQFVGGFDATEHYPAERNMEGMCQLVAQMCADAVSVKVHFVADLVLDAGRMRLCGSADPCQ